MKKDRFPSCARVSIGVLLLAMCIGSRAQDTVEKSNTPTAAPAHESVEHYTVPYEPKRTLRTQMSNRALEELLPKAQGARIRIVGRPDEDPTSTAFLARKRAINIRNYLVRHGVSALSISVEVDESPNTRQADGGFTSDVYVARESDDAVSINTPPPPAPERTASGVFGVQELSTPAKASEQPSSPAPVSLATAGSLAIVMDALQSESPARTALQSVPFQVAALQNVASNAKADAFQAAPLPEPVTAELPLASAPVVVPAQQAQPVRAAPSFPKVFPVADAGNKEPEVQPKVAVKPPFEIMTGVPIDEQLRKLASKSDWTVIWAAPEFVVDRAVYLPPDFEAALASFLKSANASGARLRATVYRGNKTVRIEEF